MVRSSVLQGIRRARALEHLADPSMPGFAGSDTVEAITAVVVDHLDELKAEIAKQHLERPNRPCVRCPRFWIERASRAECGGPPETCTGEFVLHPPALGSTFRCVAFEPHRVFRRLHNEEGLEPWKRATERAAFHLRTRASGADGADGARQSGQL